MLRFQLTANSTVVCGTLSDGRRNRGSPCGRPRAGRYPRRTSDNGQYVALPQPRPGSASTSTRCHWSAATTCGIFGGLPNPTWLGGRDCAVGYSNMPATSKTPFTVRANPVVVNMGIPRRSPGLQGQRQLLRPQLHAQSVREAQVVRRKTGVNLKHLHRIRDADQRGRRRYCNWQAKPICGQQQGR